MKAFEFIEDEGRQYLQVDVRDFDLVANERDSYDMVDTVRIRLDYMTAKLLHDELAPVRDMLAEAAAAAHGPSPDDVADELASGVHDYNPGKRGRS